MSEIYDSETTRRENIARIIRATHSGLCSGEPRGITYPGVPSVEEIAESLGCVDLDSIMSEEEWVEAWCLIDKED